MTLDVPLAMYVCCPSDVAAGLIFFGCIAMLRVLSGVLEAVDMFLSMELQLCSILVFPLTWFFLKQCLHVMVCRRVTFGQGPALRPERFVAP
jgi:hypothetical protein